MNHRGFPSQETLTAFLEQKLDPATRRRVVEHMGTCSECYERWVAATRLTKPDPSAPAIMRRRGGELLMIAVGTAIGVAIVAALLWRGPNASSAVRTEGGLPALVAAAGDLPFRTVVPRLSPPFDYRPRRAVVRGAPAAALTGGGHLTRAAALIEKETNEKPSAENLHLLGLSYLLTGRLDDALQTLGLASGAGSNVAVLTDLAAAHYVEGVKKESAREIARSLDLCDAAIALAPSNLAATFNRALALQALENRPSALAAWQRYLQLDSSSEWAAEARQQISRLSAPTPSAAWESALPRLLRMSEGDLKELAPIAERFPLRCRRTVENELLPRWARSAPEDKEARLVLVGIERIGAAIEARFADPTIADIARSISSAMSGRNLQRLESLRRGYLAYSDARTSMASDTAKARALFLKAFTLLRDAGSPSAYAAGMFAALQEYERRDYAAALRILGSMTADERLARYAPLQGQVLWMKGMVLLASGRPYESLQSYRQAVLAFQKSGEIESAAAVDGLIAENLQVLGDDDEAWKHRLRAMPVVLDHADARRQQVAFNEAGEAAMQQGLLSAALEYQTASVALAAGSGDEHMSAYSYLGRAVILGRNHRLADALSDLGRAREHAQRVADEAIRETTVADVDMAEALLRQEESPGTAISLLTRVLEFQKRGGYEFRTAQLLLARGRAHVRLGDQAEARADFSRAIAAVESQRENVPDLRLRSAFFGRAEDAYEELTALLVRAGELDEALRVFDRSCERTLTEVVRKAVTADSARIGPRTLPEGAALVHIAVLPEEIVAWTVRRSGTSVSRQRMRSQELETLATSYERAILAESDRVEIIGSKLYDLIVRPLRLDPANDRTITFIGDRRLRAIPLASLYDRSRKRFLIEDHAVVTAPSGDVYWHCRIRLAPHDRSNRFVAIGNSRTAALSLGLPDLPEAARELTEVASRMRGELLLNERATARALLAAAEEAAIVHFAGHALLNEQDRGRSALVLAPEGGDASSALLYADQIAGAKLRAPLVVLSACATSATNGQPAAGAVDVARAFLAAGVPTVVASRWEVDDDNGRELLTLLVRELAENGVSPDEALRRAQLEMLRNGDRRQRAIRSWCAFEVIGAVR